MTNTRKNHSIVPALFEEFQSYGTIDWQHNGYYLCGVGADCLAGSGKFNYTYDCYIFSIRIRKINDKNNFTDKYLYVPYETTKEEMEKEIKKIIELL